jgi:hypothetical protein
MHAITALIGSGQHDQARGGQYHPDAPPTKVSFQGVVMPVSDKDWRNAPEGTYTENSCKLYTNGFTLEVGAQITDEYDGQTYTVSQELSHGPIHSMKRYLIIREGKAGGK